MSGKIKMIKEKNKILNKNSVEKLHTILKFHFGLSFFCVKLFKMSEQFVSNIMDG